jgi:sporulation protein YlmC with PRC-barrel domain
MLKFMKKPVLAIGALIAMVGFAGPAATAQTATTPTTKQPFRVQKASDLIGKPVVNPKGESLGSVQDLALDPDRGRVAYVVLSFGGFLGMGEKWFAVPTAALTLPDSAEHFVLSLAPDRLKNAKGFDKDKWPQMGNAAWGFETHQFYGQQPYWMGEGEGSTPSDIRIQKASEIIGSEVQNDRGEKLGEIKDLMIDPDRARITYAVLSFGGFLGMGDKLFAIPAGVLQMPGTASFVVLTVDKEHLKTATGFDKSSWPNLADPVIASGLYEFYGARAYWTEDLRGGEYLASAAGKTCHHCNGTTGSKGFVREGHIYCCAGCANKTGCTCTPVTVKTRK